MTAWAMRATVLVVATVACGLASRETAAATAATNDLCRTVDVATVRRVPIDLRPSYFFKVVAGPALVAMTTEHGNTLLDLSGDSARALRIPGTYDPMPSFPDGKIVSVASGPSCSMRTNFRSAILDCLS